MSTGSLAEWYASPLGHYVLAREREYFDAEVADIFGFNAVQIGLPEVDFLRSSRIPLRLRVATDGPADLLASPAEMPIASQSVDLAILPHVLEFAREPHQILREMDRIMMPEGRVIICGFNPWSLWGLRQALTWSRDTVPWCGNFISLTRMKDWLALLGFDVSAGRLCCYAPPFVKDAWLERCRGFEAAGDRWWGIAGGVYLVQAIKRVHGMRLITPRWEAGPVANVARVAPLRRQPGVSSGKVVSLFEKR